MKNMYINRTVEAKIEGLFFTGKSIIVLGARQIGKTTLINGIIKKYPSKKVVKINGDDPDDIDQIYNKGLDFYKNLFSDDDIIFFDEAQKYLI